MKYILESEVRTWIKQLYELVVKGRSNSSSSEAVAVEMKRWFWTLNMNFIFKMVIGKRYSEVESSHEKDENERRRKAIRDVLELTATFTVADPLPFLRWLDVEGHEKAMKRTVKELDQMLEECFEEHKQKRNSGKSDGHDHDHDDFTDMLLLLLLDAGEFPTYDADTINKATCLVSSYLRFG